MIVGTWCGNVWWGIGVFGWRDRRLQEEYETGRKADEMKYISIYGCTCNNNGSTWRAGKVQYKQRFHSRGLTDIRCMFCTMVFPIYEVRKRHIMSCHWTIFEATVSISYTCCKFLYDNVIQLHMHMQLYVDSLYMKMCHFLVDVILFIFVCCRGRNRQLREDHSLT